MKDIGKTHVLFAEGKISIKLAAAAFLMRKVSNEICASCRYADAIIHHNSIIQAPVHDAAAKGAAHSAANIDHSNLHRVPP